MGSGSSGYAAEYPGTDLRLPTTGLRFTARQLRALNSHVDALHEEDQKGRMSAEMECIVEGIVQRIVDGAGQRDPRFRCCHLIALHRDTKMRSRSLEYLVTLDSLPTLNADNEDCRLQDAPVGYGKIGLTGREAEKWAEFLTPSGHLCREKVVGRWVRLAARCARARGGAASRVICARAAPRAVPYQYCYLEKGLLRRGGRPPSSSYNERGALWQLWQPSLEAALDAHCSDRSSAARVAGALNAIVDRMREGSYQGSDRALSRYAVRCAYRRRLQRCAEYQQCAARSCAASHVSHHLLLVLDSLVRLCEGGGVAGYVFPVQRDGLARGGSSPKLWAADAACLRTCLHQFHTLAVGEEIPRTPSESLEAALFSRWESLNRESKASSTPHSYSRRQLRYLCQVTQELLKFKNLLVYEDRSAFRANLVQATSQHEEHIEHLIHILAIALDQARDSYLNDFQARTGGFDRELTVYRSKKWNKLKDYYDASSACLIDAVRRDPDLRKEDLQNQTTLMRNILQWLNKGAKEDKKYLGPVLRPYLDRLYNVSLENAWFLEDFDGAKCEAEYEGLRDYCAGVHNGQTEPCMGLLDAAKRLAWAKAMVDFADRFRHVDFRLVFPTGEGLAVSYPVKLPSRREHSSARILTLSRRDKAEAKLRLARRCVLGAFNSALVGDRGSHLGHITRHESSEEILRSVKSGNFWRNATKPDIIPVNSLQDVTGTLDNVPRVRRRSRINRSATSYGFPEISITDQSDTKTLRRKYHTLKSLVYTEPVENIKELRRRPRSAGSTVRNKEALSRPSILETLDFINSVKDALYVEESGTSDAEDSAWSASDEWLLSQTSPLNLLAARSAGHSPHLALGDLVLATLQRGRFTILQELCSFLGESSEGALFALHRLGRAARSRSSERDTNCWQLRDADAKVMVAPQKYKPRPLDYVSGDEAPQPPPLPRRASRSKQITKHYPDYVPSNRLQEFEHHLTYLEHVKTRLTLNQSLNRPLNDFTGVINPIYDIKLPRDKFAVKRTKSLGRSFSSRNLGLEIARYNLTLGPMNGRRTNDVITAMNDTTAATGLDLRNNSFQRLPDGNVVGDSYRVSRVIVD